MKELVNNKEFLRPFPIQPQYKLMTWSKPNNCTGAATVFIIWTLFTMNQSSVVPYNEESTPESLTDKNKTLIRWWI